MDKKNKDINIPEPSIEEVEKYLEKWKHNKEYCNKEEALNKLFFEICPKNTDIKDILLKASTLNDFYSTNIFSIYPVAEHIQAKGIDSKLKKGDISAVSDIQNVTIGGKIKNFYSFASKYCSHHNSKDYPIYDSYVDRVLRYFRKCDKFFDFKNEDLKDYVKFKGIIIEFQRFYGLNEYSFKRIDQYLWQLGKEYFPKHINIETKRCRIRQFKQSDVDDLYLILSNPKVMEYIEEPFTLENTKDFLNKNALSYPPRVFALEYKQNKKLIGHVIFHEYHEYDEESYEIGFILSQDYWGQGIADEITKSLINYAKNKNIHSLIIECDKRQLTTQKIATNNNFKLISSENLLVYELVL
ncbi:GNAT family N-acetyltransferase [Parvimonas micra]